MAPPGKVRSGSIRKGTELEGETNPVRGHGLSAMSSADLSSMFITLYHTLSDDPFSLLLGHVGEAGDAAGPENFQLSKIPSLDGLRRVPKCFQYASVIGGLTHLLDFDILILMSNKIN